MNDMKGKQGLVCMGLLLVLSSCHTGKQITASGLQRKDFQTEVNGQHTDLFTLSNKQGQNVNPKMVFFDFSLKMIVLLKN